MNRLSGEGDAVCLGVDLKLSLQESVVRPSAAMALLDGPA